MMAGLRPAAAAAASSEKASPEGLPAPGRCSPRGRSVSVGRPVGELGAPNSPGCPLGGGRDSGARGSTPDLPPVGAAAGGASLKSPPAALSQINTEIVSPTAILTSGGGASFLKRRAKLSFGWARRMATTRSSTWTTSNRISPPFCPWSRTALVDGPALGIQEHPPADRTTRQKSKTASFIGSGVVNQSGKNLS